MPSKLIPKLHISNKNTDVKIFTYTSKEVLNKH